jgi:hypothetical protein
MISDEKNIIGLIFYKKNEKFHLTINFFIKTNKNSCEVNIYYLLG